METLGKDIRFAIRTWLKHPGFTFVAVLTLAMGIGANTTIFSVVNGLLLRPPAAVTRPERLVDIHATEQHGSSFHSFSYPDYSYYRDQNKVFAGVLAYTAMPFSMNTGAQPERIFGMLVSGNYFDVLGTRPSQGRFFLPEEDRTPGTHPVAVVSYELWQQRFGADPMLAGKTVRLNGQPFTVIGVAPRGFRGTWTGLQPDIWVPLMMTGSLHPGSDLMSRSTSGLEMVARLIDDITLPQAQTELGLLAQRLSEAYPETNRGIGVDVRRASTVPGQFRGELIGFMAILMFVVGLVLLIACANVGSMTLARASARRKEIAIRLAVGASRTRIATQLMIESVMLFLVGGAAGVLISVWATRLLLAFKPPADVPLSLDLGVDLRVLLFTLLVSLTTGLLFGLAPALQASRSDVLTSLNNDTSRGSHRSPVRNVFVVSQIAVSLVLLVTAGLFLRSLHNATAIDVGFKPEDVQTITFDVATQGYDTTKGREFYRELLERISAVPGVRAASLARMVPLNGSSMKEGISVPGNEPSSAETTTMVGVNVIGGRYFETLEIPLLYGRTFSETDKQGTPQVAIVNEAMVRRFYPGRDVSQALGQSFRIGEGSTAPQVEIVGIVKDAKYDTLGEGPQPFIYHAFQQSYSGEMTLHIRTLPGNAGNVLAGVHREVASLDKDLPLLNEMPFAEQIGVGLLPLKLAASVAGTLGMLGMLLAALGVFGVVQYSVAQRTHEIGIRISLGAQRRDVLRLILGQGLWLALLGVGIGLALAAGLTRALTSLLYGVSAVEPLVFGGVAVLLVAVALLASYIPARRAMKVDPMTALRYE